MPGEPACNSWVQSEFFKQDRWNLDEVNLTPRTREVRVSRARKEAVQGMAEFMEQRFQLDRKQQNFALAISFSDEVAQ
eukprot:CAMPEP_0198239532 /NCGR_PEP_ID=MMETSP1446-20131203/4910_1 /TAXON_ID=1461542 ORGANISM="Unidentified sp, Strain CCMP2111" /NCGR_SAMPLE_ID=MMETSP1446 /ASSEMBLY_ACC=CAM_ASM_001112 /LENGTH=77 /DNA_ID=CAMNT_0043922137 /DNA_START=487 /DNA_END=720 /DNA_ORIENTATION=-